MTTWLGAVLIAVPVLAAAPQAAAQPPVPGDPQAAPPVTAEAEPEEPPVAPWYESITLNGFLSVSFTRNANRPASRTNQFRSFDVDESTFVLDVAELVVERAAASPGEAGFRIDATVGSALPAALASPGLLRNAEGEAGDFDVHQAFLSYLAPLGSGLRIDAGKFLTHLGYELVEGYDGYNENASHSFIFTYAQPAAHVGVRLGQSLSRAVQWQVMVVNGWDVARDNNRGKSIGAGIELSPSKYFTAYLNYMGGPEQDESSHLRQALDFVAVANLGPHVTLVGNFDYGWEEAVPLADTAGGDVRNASWQGFAGYLRVALSGRVAATVRGEWFEDTVGARTGAAQTLRGVTFTPEIRFGRHFVLRGDLRRDQSTQEVFELSGGRWGRRQVTASLNALAVF